jgi:hypothetical protein
VPHGWAQLQLCWCLSDVGWQADPLISSSSNQVLRCALLWGKKAMCLLADVSKLLRQLNSSMHGRQPC